MVRMKRCLATTLKIIVSTADGTTMPWKPANNLGPKSLQSTSKTTWQKIGRERRPVQEPSGLSKTDPTNPERHYVPGYLVGHRGEGRRRNGRPQSDEEGSAQTQIRKPFRIRSGCSWGWQPGVRWSRFGRRWISLASAQLLSLISRESVPWRNYPDAVDDKFDGFGRILTHFYGVTESARRARTNKKD